MRSRAAVLTESPGKWQVVDVEVDEPKANEVRLRHVAVGLCHSDEHFATGDLPSPVPFCGGHEGSAIVESVGPGVTLVEPGDHIVTAFIPACGVCRSCAAGEQNLCDNGWAMATGKMLDGTSRMHLDGHDVAQSCFLGNFSQYSVVPERCCIRIPKDIPLEAAAMLGCGVPTGWGSAVHAGKVSPGDVVIVMGTGGIGINAVQGALHAGAARIIAVDSLDSRRKAALEFGATDAVATLDEAADRARSLTNGQGADVAIITTSVMYGSYIADAMNAVCKNGVVVATATPAPDAGDVPIFLPLLIFSQKRLQGCLYGSMSPSLAVPLFLDLYRAGRLKLDELVTRTFTLDEINDGWSAMYDGSVVRALVIHDS